MPILVAASPPRFCMNTSASAINDHRTSLPRGSAMSIRAVRLPLLVWACPMSQKSGLLILTTSAPNSARIRPAVGPASPNVQSTTVTPSNGAPSGSPVGGREVGAARPSSAMIWLRSESSSRRGDAAAGVRSSRTPYPPCRVGPNSGSTTSMTACVARALTSSRSHSSVVATIEHGIPTAFSRRSHSAAGAEPNSSMMR